MFSYYFHTPKIRLQWPQWPLLPVYLFFLNMRTSANESCGGKKKIFSEQWLLVFTSKSSVWLLATCIITHESCGLLLRCFSMFHGRSHLDLRTDGCLEKHEDEWWHRLHFGWTKACWLKPLRCRLNTKSPKIKHILIISTPNLRPCVSKFVENTCKNLPTDNATEIDILSH